MTCVTSYSICTNPKFYCSFHQFVNMLDLIRWRLHSDPFLSEIGLEARALHGGMDVKARDQTLKDFKEDPNVRVLMMSLKAGG